MSVVASRISNVRHQILERDLRDLAGRISIDGDVRSKILAAETLEDLLSECMHLSVMPGLATVPREERPENFRWPVLTLLGALFAAVAGGVLWNALNHIFHWPYFMGSAGTSLRGFHALLWGVVTTLPVPLPLLVLCRSGERRGLIVPVLLFAALGSLAAFAFHALGIREVVERAAWGYRLRETVIVIIYSMLLSIPPLLAASLTLSRGRLALPHGLILLLPSLTALASLSVTFLIDRPVSEIVQLRGFLVGFVLRLSVFFSLLWAFRLSVNRRADGK